MAADRSKFNEAHYKIDDTISSIRDDISNLDAKEAQDVEDINNRIDDITNTHNKDVLNIINDCTNIHKELDESVVHIGDSTTELNFDKLSGAVIANDKYVKNKAVISTSGDGTITPDVLVLEATTTKIIPHNSIAGATISASNITFTEADGTKHTVAYDDTVQTVTDSINDAINTEISNREKAISDLAGNVSNDLYNKVSYKASDNVETITTERSELDTLVINANNVVVAGANNTRIGNKAADDTGTYAEVTDNNITIATLNDNGTVKNSAGSEISTRGISQWSELTNQRATVVSNFLLDQSSFELKAAQEFTADYGSKTASSDIYADLDEIDITHTVTDPNNGQTNTGVLSTAANAINSTVTDALNKTTATFEVTTGYSKGSLLYHHGISSHVSDSSPVEFSTGASLTKRTTNTSVLPDGFHVERYDQVRLSDNSTWPARSSISLYTNSHKVDAASRDPLFGAQQFRVSVSSGTSAEGANLYFDEKDLLHADAYDKATLKTNYFRYVYDGYNALHIAPTEAGENLTYINILDDTGITTSNLKSSTVNTSIITADTVNADIVNTGTIINPTYVNSSVDNYITVDESKTKLYRRYFDEDDGTSTSADISVWGNGSIDLEANGENYTANILLSGGRSNAIMSLNTRGEGGDAISLNTSIVKIASDTINANISNDVIVGCSNINVTPSQSAHINASDEVAITADIISISASTELLLTDSHIKIAGPGITYYHAYNVGQHATASLQDSCVNCVRVGGDYISLKAYNGFAMAGSTYKALADLEEWTFTLADGSTTKKLVLASGSYRTRS